MTITLSTCKTQVIWRSADVGDKTTSIPGSVAANDGYQLDIKTTLGNGDLHTVTPTSGTIGGAADFSFTDESCNLFLISDAENNDWVIKCLCCIPTVFTIGGVSFDGATVLWNWPAMSDSPTGSMSVWLYVSLSQWSGTGAWSPDNPDGDLYDLNNGSLIANPQSNPTNAIVQNHYSSPIITTISSANPAVVSTSIPHGLPNGAIVLIQLQQIGPADAWTGFNKTLTVSNVTASTFEVDFSTLGFPAYHASSGNINVYNASSMLFADTGTSDAGQFTSTPMDTGRWVNMLVSWYTGLPAGSKIFHLYYDDTEITVIQVSDGDPAFDVPYSEPSVSEEDSWMIGGTLPSGEFNSGTGIVAYMAEFWFAPGQFLDFSDPFSRALFHDIDGNAISLGDDGSLPTGTAPAIYLHVPSTTTNPYVELGLPLRYVNCQYGGASTTANLTGITTSPLMVISYWMWGGDHIAVDMDHVQIETSTQLGTTFVSLSDSTFAKNFSFEFSSPTTPGPRNVCFAVDTNHAIGAKLVLAYVDNVSVAVTVTTDDSNSWSIDFTNSGFMGFAEDNGFTAEFWFGPAQYFDPVDKFCDSGGDPVDLGTDGSTPSGVAPSVYLSCRGSDPASEFATNRGTGGALTEDPAGFRLVPDGATFLLNRADGNNLALNSEWGSFGLAPSGPTTP